MRRSDRRKAVGVKDTCEYVVGFADGAQKQCGKEAEVWLPSVMRKAPVPLCTPHSEFTTRPVSEWKDIKGV